MAVVAVRSQLSPKSVDNGVENALKAVARPEALSCRGELVKKASKSPELRAVKACPGLGRLRREHCDLALMARDAVGG